MLSDRSEEEEINSAAREFVAQVASEQAEDIPEDNEVEGSPIQNFRR